MTTDRKLLELAAKAAGIDLAEIADKYEADWMGVWNPLEIRSNAFDLMVTLELESTFDNGQVHVGNATEPFGLDKSAAARRAIVRAAAEIGRPS